MLKNEEGKDDNDPGGGTHTEKVSLKTSDSLESLYSLNSGQSSSSKYKTPALLIQSLDQYSYCLCLWNQSWWSKM